MFRTEWYNNFEHSRTNSSFLRLYMLKDIKIQVEILHFDREMLICIGRVQFYTDNAQGGSLMTGKFIGKSSVRIRHKCDFRKSYY